MDDRAPQIPAGGHAGDVTEELVRLLPELAVALYESAPHHRRGRRPLTAEPLTGRQMEAVVFLSHRRRVTMGEFAGGLQISPAARRVVFIRLAGEAERYAGEVHKLWRRQLDTVFARYPSIDPGTLVAFLGDLIDQLKGRGGP